MEFLVALVKLNDSKEFKDWKKEHKDSYLTYGFTMSGMPDWQIGYYSKKIDMIVTFIIAEEVSIKPDEEVFKKDKSPVQELDVSKIKVTLAKAIDKANDVQKKKYKTHDPLKHICILQKLPLGQVWNITFVTRTFKTLNIKIDSETGVILEDNLISVFEFSS